MRLLVRSRARAVAFACVLLAPMAAGSARGDFVHIVPGSITDTPDFFTISWQVNIADSPAAGTFANAPYVGDFWPADINVLHLHDGDNVKGQHLKPIDSEDGGGPGGM